ncbi:unnamed protein product [Prunus armeniaca]
MSPLLLRTSKFRLSSFGKKKDTTRPGAQAAKIRPGRLGTAWILPGRLGAAQIRPGRLGAAQILPGRLGPP